jgi:ABC-2 type transport system ATP-binding protein
METVISIKNLYKTYRSGKYANEVLRDISFDVQPGKIIGYIGPNGAGKSTTIKILSGIISDFTGDVTILGMDIRKDALEIKRHIGYIPENAALYEVLTPTEYLLFIGQLYGMNEHVIADKAKKLFDLFDLGNVGNQRMTTFSKGMKQKVLIISGLIHNPDIIFLDEPLNGLDANSVMVVKEVLRQLAADGKTIFYSSHIMDVVEKISDRIILISEGKVVADGSFAEINNASGDTSLENLFSRLTGNSDHSAKAEEIINIFETK